MNERKVVVMNKMNEGNLNEVAISLAALKQSDVGDEVVLMTADNQVGWFSVQGVVATRGCKGGTTLTLRDLASGDVSTVFVSNSLPEGVARVRRVSAGVNARTTRKLAAAQAAAAAAKPAVVQPAGEFENILDVPMVDEGQEGTEATAAQLPETLPAPAETETPSDAPAIDALPAIEPVAEASETAPEAPAAIEELPPSTENDIAVG